MYTKEELAKYKYFDGAELNFVLDSLTGVISRQYILDFARKLVDSKTPFAMCMMDLDNFKYVNDSYGHHAGDICLQRIAEGLKTCVGENGLVGRFGGDEFVILYLKSNEYDDVHDFLADIYGEHGALRKFLYIENVRLYVTATTGSASYPKDADNYNELFMKMDKALYRGKSKGRNCYIVYVHEKHKDIVVSERGTNSLLSKIHDIKNIVDSSDNETVVDKAIDYIFRILHPADVLYIDKDNNVKTAKEKKDYHFGKNVYFMLTKMSGDKEIFPSSNPKDIKDRFPDTIEYMDKNKVHAFVMARVSNEGFMILYENAVTRMWQDYDLVLINVTTILLSHKLCK